MKVTRLFLDLQSITMFGTQTWQPINTTWNSIVGLGALFTTLNMISSVTYYLELRNTAIY